MTNLTSIDLAYAITLRQFWASLIALGIKTVETIRSWPAPERLVGQTIASMPANGGPPTGRFHRTGAAGQLSEDWRRTIPSGTVLAPPPWRAWRG